MCLLLYMLHTMEYYSAIMKKGILPFLVCMDLEVIMRNGTGQMEKDKYNMIILICGI